MNAARLAKTALKIPKRIERGPTDILKALASTIKFIPSEPEITIQDDPFLLPKRQSERRLFILSKLSGVKTAKYFLDNKPELFYRDDAEPKIEAFLPKEEFSPEMEFTDDDIKWCIENKDPVNGIIAYTSLAEKKVKLNDEILLQFFEMICYTNEEASLDHVDHERSRFIPESEEQLVNQTWKNSGIASKIFNQVKNDLDVPRVFSAMIAGLSKFNEHATAKQLFDEFREKHPDKALYLDAYDGLLKSVPRLHSSVATAHEAIDDIVKHMESNLVQPDLLIFNSILLSYRSFQVDEETCRKAFKLLNDMKTLNIRPSLASYGSLLGIICRQRAGRVYGGLIPDILNQVENLGCIAEIRDSRDLQFLHTAMNAIANMLNNVKFAHRLHRIYLNNHNLFPNQKLRHRYLDNYFKLIVTADSIEQIMEFYNTYVPMTFQPSSDCYEALAEALDLYQAPESFIQKVGQDLIQFRVRDLKNDAIFKKDPAYVEALENIK